MSFISSITATCGAIKNVINECIRLNQSGVVSPLAIETSGHGALSENYYLDDGAYLAVKLLIAAAQANKAGKAVGDLVANLKHPAESKEYRLKIQGTDDVKAYGERYCKPLKSGPSLLASSSPSRRTKACASYSLKAGRSCACPSTTRTCR